MLLTNMDLLRFVFHITVYTTVTSKNDVSLEMKRRAPPVNKCYYGLSRQ